MRRIAVGVLASGLLVAGSGSAGAGTPSESFPLYSAGERVDDLPLVAVLHRDDSAEYVSFLYGDCIASSDTGCAPPAEIQVWPACRRNLALYEDSPSSAGVVERITVRGVPAALLDDGTRLELETGRSTVVVFARTRAHAFQIAAALRSLDGSVTPEHPLPRPVRGREGGAMGC
jgi:hypothetical protein